jgi:DNA polymerase-1
VSWRCHRIGVRLNLQTLPRTELVIKRAFVPKLDAFLSADYSNIELRLLAFYLDSIGYPEMVEVFKAGADLHEETARSLFGVSEVSKEQRHVAKTLNFSIVYGGGVPTLVRQGVAEDGKQAMEMLRAYHGKWPGIGWESKRAPAKNGTLVAAIKETLEKRGWITTLYGRHLKPKETHKALNALVQGCAADLAKQALVNIHHGLKAGGYQSHLVNFIHDEVVLDAAADELDALSELVPDWMVDERVDAVVPIRPECDVSWTTLADKEPIVRQSISVGQRNGEAVA